MFVASAVHAAVAGTLRAALYRLYRNGPRSLGGWGGARDATVCAELRGTTSEDVWRGNPLACDDEIQADFEAKFVLLTTLLGVLTVLMIFVRMMSLAELALRAAAASCARRVLGQSSRDKRELALVRRLGVRRERRRQHRLRTMRRRRAAIARGPLMVKDAFRVAPRLSSMSSLVSSPGTLTPDSTWTRSPSPDVATPLPGRIFASRTARRTSYWPGTPAQSVDTSDASM